MFFNKYNEGFQIKNILKVNVEGYYDFLTVSRKYLLAKMSKRVINIKTIFF